MPGPRLVFRIALGDFTLPLGGILTLSTCGLTAADTLLYVGTGCPTWAASFACLRGNDNAGDVPGQAACAPNPGASTLSLTLTASRVVFVQVAAAAGGELVSGLRWSYEPPASRSATKRLLSPAATRSASGTKSRLPSVSQSRSRSRKAKA